MNKKNTLKEMLINIEHEKLVDICSECIIKLNSIIREFYLYKKLIIELVKMFIQEDVSKKKIDMKDMKINEFVYIVEKFHDQFNVPKHILRKKWQIYANKFTLNGKNITPEQLKQAKKGMVGEKGHLAEPPKRQEKIDYAIDIILESERKSDEIIKKYPKRDKNDTRKAVINDLLNHEDKSSHPLLKKNSYNKPHKKF